MQRQFSNSENSAKIAGISSIGPVVRNHISSSVVRELIAKKNKLCTICGPWFIGEFLKNTFTYFFIIFITGYYIWHQTIRRKSSTRKKWKYEWRASEKPTAYTNRNRKQKEKWMTRRSTMRSIAWLAGSVAGIQRAVVTIQPVQIKNFTENTEKRAKVLWAR